MAPFCECISKIDPLLDEMLLSWKKKFIATLPENNKQHSLKRKARASARKAETRAVVLLNRKLSHQLIITL